MRSRPGPALNRSLASLEEDAVVPASMWDVPTPALVLDVDAMTRNLDLMQDHFRGSSVALRPHAKTHKSPVIARRQLGRGAIGICVAKLREAASMIDAGLEHVLLTTAVVDRRRIARVAALSADCPGFQVVTDHMANVDDLAEATLAAGGRLGVLVDLDCGAHRTGAALGPEAVALAQHIARQSSLRFAGFQAFGSHVMHIEGYDARRRANLEMLAQVVETRRMAERGGLDVETVSVGGTGTYDVDSGVDGITDVQAGSYAFMDVMYRAIGGPNGPIFDDFEPALFVLCTAISQPSRGEITVDAGYKASATDHQPPEPWGVGDVSYRFAGDEHGILTLHAPTEEIRIGSRVRLLASHCDPTVNLYDSYWVCSGTRVVGQWAVEARGMSQ